MVEGWTETGLNQARAEVDSDCPLCVDVSARLSFARERKKKSCRVANASGFCPTCRASSYGLLTLVSRAAVQPPESLVRDLWPWVDE